MTPCTHIFRPNLKHCCKCGYLKRSDPIGSVITRYMALYQRDGGLRVAAGSETLPPNYSQSFWAQVQRLADEAELPPGEYAIVWREYGKGCGDVIPEMVFTTVEIEETVKTVVEHTRRVLANG